ncbi:3-oxoacyl-[acyl-carrier-protein] synthase III C-terminal domain-containing protein [Niallia sp. 03133]|uniref:3-oxoacyl-[acyl-carrier-protein] synthase III C-terminal domain-containing protein n=1 Tax=Niallia sp. 03133 TaxID=3458060 RepID=UPI004043ED36
MLGNAKFSGISTFHPEQAYDNDFFVQHFKELGLQADGLMNHLGRKTRYLVNPEKENTITLAINAAEKVLKQTNTAPETIDMLVFVSDTPEYTYPSNALFLHQKLKTNNAHIVYDMNANCIGLLSAIDQVSTYVKAHPSVKKALIISSVHISNIARKDDTITLPNFADGAAALILEKTEENVGLLSSNYYTNSKLFETVMYPTGGFSSLYEKTGIALEEKKLTFIPHDVSYFSDDWKRLIIEMLEKQGLEANSINHWIFSQFSRPEIEETLTKLEVGLDKYTFVGEDYGYTGVTSPLFALEDALLKGNIKPGDKVVLCSVAIGYSMAALLYQF